jgi:hypothetical protein
VATAVAPSADFSRRLPVTFCVARRMLCQEAAGAMVAPFAQLEQVVR